MSKTIVVYCGAAKCGAVIAKKVVPNVAAEQAKALVPAVLECPNAAKKHPDYPAVHTRVEIEPGPKKKSELGPSRGVETGQLAPRQQAAAFPNPEPPEGATLGMAHMGPTGPDDRKYEEDEQPTASPDADLTEDLTDVDPLETGVEEEDEG